MTSKSRSRWIRLCGVASLALLVFASLMLPAQWEQLRTGHWFIEHFLGYFAASLIIGLGWPWPFVVAGGLMAAAAVLEVLQSLTPNHSPSFVSVLGGASGALAAALIVKFITSVRNRRASAREEASRHR
jgi:VanZ family protein